MKNIYPYRNFESYEDFYQSYEVRIPNHFNFGFDVVDAIAAQTPKKLAMMWCDDQGEERAFSFGDMCANSNKAANLFKAIGIGKGDPVMLILKRRYEYWFAVLALHKIGAVAIPATHLLTTKDIAYRNNAAKVKAIVCVSDADVIQHVDEAEKKSPTLRQKIAVQTSRSGWHNFTEAIEQYPDTFQRPSPKDDVTNNDMMLLYFTSGTTGMPKMVQHNFAYPLGHILTAKYWQNVEDNGLHLTVAETGWAKAAWGKIYGHWLAGSAVMK